MENVFRAEQRDGNWLMVQVRHRFLLGIGIIFILQPKRAQGQVPAPGTHTIHGRGTAKLPKQKVVRDRCSKVC